MAEERKAEEITYKGKPLRQSTIPLSVLKDQQFYITGVEFLNGKFGEIAIVKVEDIDIPFRTTSKVIIKQLKNYEAFIKSGYALKCKLNEIEVKGVVVETKSGKFKPKVYQLLDVRGLKKVK